MEPNYSYPKEITGACPMRTIIEFPIPNQQRNKEMRIAMTHY